MRKTGEVHHIAKQSNVGIVIDEEKIPIDVDTFKFAVEIGLEPSMCACNGGEDYELLFTINQTDFEKIKSNSAIQVIGYCTDDKKIILKGKQGQDFDLPAQGWENIGQ